LPTDEERSAAILASYMGDSEAPVNEAPVNEDPRAAEILSRYVEQDAAPVTPAPEQKLDLVETALGGLGALGQGATFGFADEIGSGIYAAGKSALTDETFDDVYDRAMGHNKANREGFSDENPATALGLELAGGLGSGGAAGAKLLPSAVRAANALRLGRVATPAAVAGIGAVEGGLTGAGTADEGNILQGAAEGAAFGAALPVALGGLGKVGGGLLNVASNRRVAQELGKGPNAIPLSIAAKGTGLGDFYATSVGKAYGGKDAMLEQTQPFINEAKPALDKALAVFDDKKLARTIKQFEGNKQITQGAEAAQGRIAGGLRKTVINSAMPDSIPVGLRTEITGAKDSRDAMEKLQSYWTSDGFKDAKGKTFKINANSVRESLDEALKDPMMRDLAGSNVDDVMDEIANLGTKSRKLTTIKSDDLLEIKNRFGRAANDTNDDASRAMFRKISSVLDDSIVDNLGVKARAGYLSDKSKWGTFSRARRSADSAADRNLGQWNPTDFLKTGASNQKRVGGAALQGETEAAQAGINRIKASVAALKANNPLKRQLQRESRKSDDALKRVTDNSAYLENLDPSTSNVFTKLAATTTSGGPLGAYLLSRQGTQRALAGQTAPQEMIAAALRNYSGPSIANLATSTAPVGALLSEE
tara:strand:+ start:608 stop:2551 length:1944 start_codon:yes stop_codon:yes gene_type:complete